MKHGQFVRFPDRDRDREREREDGIVERRYLTEDITVPIFLIHGDRDSLFTLEPFVEHLPCVMRFELEGYEHIDVVWGENVHVDVIPKVLAILYDRGC
jgi:lysosomal acid lipase/cholesteryl ester hydrolase